MMALERIEPPGVDGHGLLSGEKAFASGAEP